MKGLLIAALAALGALLGGMVKADLEDEKVCRWLARKLVYRATQCLPADERDRWREELIRDLLDLEGRVAPLLWAFSVYLQAGRWGRMRGMPSRWEVLVARTRAAWQRLRSLPLARARSKERHPASSTRAQAQVEVAQVVATATMTARGITRSTGSATLGYSLETAFTRYRKSLPHLSDEEVVTLLSQSRHEFEADLDRKIARFRRERDRALRLPDLR